MIKLRSIKFFGLIVDSLIILIPMTVLLVLAVIVFFVLTVRSGQYDDMEGPAHRMIMDDDDPMIPEYHRKKKKPKKNRTEST